jgi:hypothetical protein
VDVASPDLGSIVSLPTSARFRARSASTALRYAPPVPSELRTEPGYAPLRLCQPICLRANPRIGSAITGVILTTQENEGWTPAPAAVIINLDNVPNGVLGDHTLFVCGDDVDTNAAGLRTDPDLSRAVGALVEDRTQPGASCADARPYF